MEIKHKVKEYWKDIEGYPGYCISSLGKVINKNSRWKSKLINGLKPRPGGYKNLYYRVCLHAPGMPKDVYIHRAMLIAFSGNPPTSKHQAAHLNGIHSDNRIDNLAWVTPLQNSKHKIKHGTSGKGTKNSMVKLNEESVLKIMRLYANGVSSKSLSEKFKVSRENIILIINGLSWKHLKISKSLKLKINKNKNEWKLRGLYEYNNRSNQ